jgi:hypothetical protein
MIEASPAQRMASPDEIAIAANFCWDQMQDLLPAAIYSLTAECLGDTCRAAAIACLGI